MSRRIPRRYVGLIYLALTAGAVIAALVISKKYHVGVAATIITVLIGLPGLYLAWVAFRRSGDLDPTLAALADQLAGAVRRQWEGEAELRRIFDPYPLPVSWKAADERWFDDWESLTRLASSWPDNPVSPTPPGVGGPASLAGSDGEITDVLTNRVPTRRLVVLGEPGAGKTILLVRLVLGLLAAREPGNPVPILAPLASWNPQEQDLHVWLEARLTTDYPGLREPASSPSGDTSRLRALLDNKLLFLILDGLDELPRNLRGLALVKVNSALRPGEGVVLSSRANEYREALDPGDSRRVRLHGAAGIELAHLDATDIETYLRQDSGTSAAARWNPVFAALGSTMPVAQVFRTPLMVGLARTIYNPQQDEPERSLPDPAELCDQRRFRTGRDIERHLFDAFISAAYRRSPGSDLHWKADDATQFLVFLARRLRNRSGDIAWWNLTDASPKHLASLTLGILVAIASAVAYPFIGWGLGIFAGLIVGLCVRAVMKIHTASVTHGLLGSLLGGVIAALLALVILGPGVRAYRESGLLAAGLAVGVATASINDFMASFIGSFVGSTVACFYEHAAVFSGERTAVGPWLHLFNAFGFGLAAVVFVEMTDQMRPARRLRLSPVWLALGAACGAVLGVGVWLQAGWVQGLVAGFTIVIAGALVGSMGKAVTADLTEPADPTKILRRDRNYFLTSWLGFGLTFGVGGGLALAISPNINGQLNGARMGVYVGLANVVVVGLTFAFVQTIWGSFSVARFWLAMSHRLPWQYMSFLEDAHNRGVLRQVGAAYQFRHAELQRHLTVTGVPGERADDSLTST